MKSQRRHELQHNVLDAELAKGVDFFKKHLTQIGWVLIIGALIIMVVFYNKSQRQRRATDLQSQFDQLAAIMPPSNDEEIVQATAGWKDLAGQEKDRAIAADANVYLGSIYARVAVSGQRSTLILAGESPSQQSQMYYTTVVSNFPDQPQAVAKALLGLGRLAEDSNDLEAARAKFQAVLDMPEAKGFPVAETARNALNRIEASSSPVHFATTAPVEPAETQPATQPATVDGQ